MATDTGASTPTGTCPVCWTPAGQTPGNVDGALELAIDCSRCGVIRLTGELQLSLMAHPLVGRAMVNASGWAHEHQGEQLTKSDEPLLRNLPTPTIGERGEKLIRHLARSTPGAGYEFSIRLSNLSMLAVTWSETVDEVHFIAWEYLGKEKGFLSPDIGSPTQYGNSTKITPRGWAFLEVSGMNPTSDIGFVAMSFADDLKAVYVEAIKPAIEAAGYVAVRIDDHRHEGLIDAEIIAAIRRSRFVVADFTNQSGGVYYEAGFARGLGLKIVRTCRKDHAEQMHFDQNHYHVLRWQSDEHDELRRELKARIEASLGVGPRATRQ